MERGAILGNYSCWIWSFGVLVGLSLLGWWYSRLYVNRATAGARGLRVRCSLGSRTAYAVPNPRVRTCFFCRLGCTSAEAKRANALYALWQVSPRLRAAAQNLGYEKMQSRVAADVRKVIGAGEFFLISMAAPPPVGGIAQYNGTCEPPLLLGVEKWLFALGPWLESGLDHEMTHCLQEAALNAITRHCRGPIGVLESFTFELHAHVYGGPLWFFSFLGLLLAPCVI
jgi:hypothetical protein